MCVCVCACVCVRLCVCVCERERERESVRVCTYVCVRVGWWDYVIFQSKMLRTFLTMTSRMVCQLERKKSERDTNYSSNGP